MRKLLIATAILFVVCGSSIAQSYSGSVGTVVAHDAWIELNTWTRKFRGEYEFVPGVWVGMTGSAKSGKFKVDGWFETPAKITANSILGDGVQLWRMNGVVRRGSDALSRQPRLGFAWERLSSVVARNGLPSTSTSAPSAIGFIRGTI